MKSNFETIINKEHPVLVDFYADWCGPCQTMAPILKETKETLGDAISIIKIDVDKNPALAQRFQVKSIPTLLLFNKGNIAWRQSGVVPKRDLLAVLKPYLQN